MAEWNTYDALVRGAGLSDYARLMELWLDEMHGKSRRIPSKEVLARQFPMMPVTQRPGPPRSVDPRPAMAR